MCHSEEGESVSGGLGLIWLHHLLAVRPFVSYLTFQCLYFLSCKLEMIMKPVSLAVGRIK